MTHSTRRTGKAMGFQTPLAPDPFESYPDALVVLDRLGEGAFPLIETLLSSASRSDSLVKFLRAVRRVRSTGQPHPRKEVADRIETDDIHVATIDELPRNLRDAAERIVQRGVVASGLQPQQVAELLRCPEAVEYINLEIAAREGTYWQTNFEPCDDSSFYELPAEESAVSWVGRPLDLLERAFESRARLSIAASLLLVLASGATAVNGFMKLSHLRHELGLDNYVRFDHEDEESPSIDPKRARPLAVVGRKVWLEGWARSNIVKQIDVTVEPGLESDEPLTHTLEIGGDAVGEGEKRFRWKFVPPGDGVTRTVTIRLVPHEDSKRAEPRLGQEENTTYRVYLACRPDGPAALYEGAKLLITDIKVEDGEAFVGVWAQLPIGTPVAVVAGTSGEQLRFVEAQTVVNPGEKMLFRVGLVADQDYDVRVFALEEGERDALVKAIQQQDYEKLVSTDKQTVQNPSKKETER